MFFIQLHMDCLNDYYDIHSGLLRIIILNYSSFALLCGLFPCKQKNVSVHEICKNIPKICHVCINMHLFENYAEIYALMNMA